MGRKTRHSAKGCACERNPAPDKEVPRRGAGGRERAEKDTGPGSGRGVRGTRAGAGAERNALLSEDKEQRRAERKRKGAGRLKEKANKPG